MFKNRESNLILMTDSYKPGHEMMRVNKTLANHEYLAARQGAEFDVTVFAGLQGVLLDHLVGYVFNAEDIEQASQLFDQHVGPGTFPKYIWHDLYEDHGGTIPLDIRAVPEGTPIPVGHGNALMTVESTDERYEFLAGWFESLLQHVWYPTTVATLSWHVRELIQGYVIRTGGTVQHVDYMLHDFGFRSSAGTQAAERGGMAHLINFKGTDTLLGLMYAAERYFTENCVGNSVYAAEHNVMTQLGRDGESEVAGYILDTVPQNYIVSMPIDSYDSYGFVEMMYDDHADKIFRRAEAGGKFVFRPDSTTRLHPTPEEMSLELLGMIGERFGTVINPKGYLELDSSVGMLWGDGLSLVAIDHILSFLTESGFAAHNMVFGMGGGLLHSGVARDTQRFAIKSSAQKREDGWHDVKKETPGKSSLGGRLALVCDEDGYKTVRAEEADVNLLEPVFFNGELLRRITFEDVRKNAGWIK